MTSLIKQLILQPTSLCNLNCRYCYVPGRKDSSVMDENILETSMKLVLTSDFLGDEISILYHAGEPMTVGMDFYKKAVELAKRYQKPEIKVFQTMQTNGVLVNQKWCDFLREEDFAVGVSIDGPQFLHDQNRKNWSNQGSFQKSLKGYHQLKSAGVKTGVLSVITKDHLDYPDELFSFYLEQGIDNVGFNIEETENANLNSSHATDDPTELIKTIDFISRIYDLWYESSDKISIREIDRVVKSLYLKNKNSNFQTTVEECQGLSLLTIQKNGDISTFSPEFAGIKSEQFNDFVIGNILNVNHISELENSYFYLKLKASIEKGKAVCEKTCSHFDFCGSAYLASRYTENGTLEKPLSLSCILQQQTFNHLILEKISLQKAA